MAPAELLRWMHKCSERNRVPTIIPLEGAVLAAAWAWDPHPNYESDPYMRALTCLVALKQAYELAETA
jgi:hypothetical protein